MTPRREVELFDREKFDYFLDVFLRNRSVEYQPEELNLLRTFIQSECRRNRDEGKVEGAKEFAEKVRPNKESNPYSDNGDGDDADLEAGWFDCMEMTDAKITQALSELESENKRGEAKE